MYYNDEKVVEHDDDLVSLAILQNPINASLAPAAGLSFVGPVTFYKGAK
jgi:hypothetical protein